MPFLGPRNFARWLLSSARPPLRLFGEPSLEPPVLGSPRRILWVRTDAIGDAVLASDQLARLHGAFPQAELHVACQAHLAELYGAAPFPLAVHPFERRPFRRSAAYRRDYLRRIRALDADLALNGVYSRETLTDAITLASGAPVRVAWRGDLARTRAHKLRFLERFYSHLVPEAAGDSEPARNAAFLAHLGLPAGGYGPRVWTSAEDEAFADATFRAQGLDPARTLALMAGALSAVRRYDRYGEALRRAFPEGDLSVVALGAASDGDISQQALDQWGGPSLNLCGTTTLRQSAALLSRCRLAFGAETGLAHMAAAVGTPQVVLLGGGHFGRFMPYGPEIRAAATAAACLPLACFGCDWRCPYERAHCVTDLPPALLAEALRSAWTAPSEGHRLFAPASAPPLPPGPAFDPAALQRAGARETIVC